MARRFHLSVLLLSALAASAASLAAPANSLPEQSPFLPPPTAAAPATVDTAIGYHLSGMTVVGRDTLLSITREADKRSTWIPVGKTTGEITVVRYDAANDRAVIRVAGQEHTLTMRQPTVISAPASVTPLIPAPSFTAAPLAPASDPAAIPAPVAMPPLSVQEEKEMEARMLVTDLLEIGQRQRQAYAEAQRQAAAQKAAEAARAAAQK